MTSWRLITFQDGISPIIIILSKFHDKTIVIIIFIISYVLSLMCYFYINTVQTYLASSHELELVWTIYPALTLIIIALPSLRILYLLDDLRSPFSTVKCIGHQWYWSYGLRSRDFFDSYILPESELELGQSRLLEVDNRLVVPVGVDLRILISSSDVLHSWTIPSLGIKADAVPGRLNQVPLIILLPGVFYGQCSEICGANHRFIPICLESVAINEWLNWIDRFIVSIIIYISLTLRKSCWMIRL